MFEQGSFRQADPGTVPHVRLTGVPTASAAGWAAGEGGPAASAGQHAANSSACQPGWRMSAPLLALLHPACSLLCGRQVGGVAAVDGADCVVVCA